MTSTPTRADLPTRGSPTTTRTTPPGSLSTPAAGIGRPPAENLRYVTAEVHPRPEEKEIDRSAKKSLDHDDNDVDANDDDAAAADVDASDEQTSKSRLLSVPASPSASSARPPLSSRLPSEGTIDRLEGLRVGDASTSAGDAPAVSGGEKGFPEQK